MHPPAGHGAKAPPTRTKVHKSAETGPWRLLLFAAEITDALAGET